MTPKQENFCLSYIETGNASEAYRRSYNAKNMSPESINVKASELLKNGKVAVRLQQLQQHHQKRHDVTIDTITAELFADREAAREAKQFGASVSALKTIATMHGLITNKQEVTGKDGGPLTVLTDIERGAKLAGLMALAEARKKQAEASKYSHSLIPGTKGQIVETLPC